ncbi:NHL repeat-containing protein [Flindersiella endophytica]
MTLGRVAWLAAGLLATSLISAVPAATASPAGDLAGPAAAPACALTDLGSPMASITVHEGGFGPGPDGKLRAYAAVSGENAALNVIDAETGDRIDAVPLPGASGGWGVTVDDGGKVYIGSYYNGTLYSYDPATGKVTDHGKPVESEGYLYGLSHAPDGRIFGGTTPGAHAFSFDPATGEAKDLGAFTIDGAKYVRATAYAADTDTLYVGLGATGTRLFAIDLATGDRREIAVPDPVKGTIVSDLRYYDGKLFAYLDAKLVVFNAATGEHLPLTDGETGQQVASTSLISRAVSPPKNGVVYFSNFGPGTTTHRLMTLDLDSLTFRPAERADSAGALAGAAIGFGWDEGPNGPVLRAFTGNYAGQAIAYDVTTHVLTKQTYDLLPTEPNLGHVIAGLPDANGDALVYANAFLNGNTATYNPKTQASQGIPRFGQVEGWTWHDGKLYSGIYPTGTVQVWDPATPTVAPKPLFALEQSHHQNRPMAVVADSARLYVGTTPGYGLYGGALTIYDFDKQSFEVHRNLIQDQSISALLKTGDVLLGGSSVDGGTGSGDPLATEAKLFTSDPVTGAVQRSWVPVPGAHSINALTKTANGEIWGLADGTAFRFDLAKGRVTKRVQVYPAEQKSGATDGELIAHPNGKLYGVSRSQSFVVDPKAGESRRLHTGVNRLALHPDGTLYTLTRTPGGTTQDTNRLARFNPATTGCR